MGCRDGGPSGPYADTERKDRTYVFRVLLGKFANVSMSEFTLEESLLMHKMHVADAFRFPPEISEEELALLKDAEQRIFWKKKKRPQL